MTFSIVARCASTGMFGVAVSSSPPAVAARCAHARAGIGAVASQNVTDPALGRRALDLMALGAEVVDYDRATESREKIAARLAEASGATLVRISPSPSTPSSGMRISAVATAMRLPRVRVNTGHCSKLSMFPGQSLASRFWKTS